MKELLRSHSISYVQGLRIALEAQGIRAVLLDEQAPAYLSFAGRVRLAVAEDADYERAMAIVRALEAPPSPRVRPRSWVRQRRGLISGAMGLALLIVEVGVADSAPRPLVFALLAVAIGLMATGLALIALGPRRDRAERP
ncbi:MAG: DUF2007 domain-containing protein [Gemmatimonadetes bacterium]|nr:MAG: DUF2007 domain-containing protein [Gemmatimonadota bacterium]